MDIEDDGRRNCAPGTQMGTLWPWLEEVVEWDGLEWRGSVS
jgi:hypothetical protein